jgi:hypothetical protein
MKGVTYSDVLAMPTYERRFFLSLLTKQLMEKQEYVENIKKSNKNEKGSRSSTISGDALKSRIRNGDIPNK